GAGPLNDPEIETLWEVAVTPEEPLRSDFLEEAVRNPGTSRQLRDRSAPALHAAVGLGARRREAAERLLADRLSAEGVTPQQRTDLAFTLAALGGLSPPAAARAAEALTRALGEPNDHVTLVWLSGGLSALAARMDAAGAAEAARA